MRIRPARPDLLLAAIAKGHVLLLSSEMAVELARVLRYPRPQRLFGLTEEQVYNYVQFLKEVTLPIIPDHTLAVPIRDSQDAVLLQTAVSGEADIICTVDRDFYDSDTIAFCATSGIDVCDDIELARRIANAP